MLVRAQFCQEIGDALVCILDGVLFGRAVDRILRFFMFLRICGALDLTRLASIRHGSVGILIGIASPSVVHFLIADGRPLPLALPRRR